MTRINTNVSSLTAQKTLARSNAQLQTSLTRLSTGLRINSGKDDPAGLIASEVLRSDIASTQKAISNSERANQIIGTADSALGQVTSLLTDIRGLVTEAANKGAMSDEQIAANQLQIDSSLEALNRISQSTTFQGRRLLDGSLDFVVNQGAGMANVSDLQIDSAMLPASGSLAVNVDVTSAASQAKITNTGFTAGAKAETTFSFAAGATTQKAAGDNVLNIMSNSLTSGSGVTFKFAQDVNAVVNTATVAYSGANEITFTVSSKAGSTGVSAAYLANLVNTSSDTNIKNAFYAVGSGADTTKYLGTEAAITTVSDSLKIAANTTTGADYNNVAVSFAVGNVGATTPTVSYDSTSRQLKITIDDDTATDIDDIVTQIGLYKVGGVQLFAGTKTSGGGAARDTIYAAGGADRGASGNTGASGGNALKGDVVFQLSSDQGSQVYQFKSGTTVDQIVNAINLQTDATGVVGSYAVATGAATLNLQSSSYGSDAFVASDVISEAAAGTFKVNLSAARGTGTNIAATINGFTATGKGNTLSLNSPALSMTATVANGSSNDFAFTITGGGALFQLGPDVVSTQQARVGISSVNTSKLGGVNGRLYQLASGQTSSLANNVTNAARIVDDVMSKVTGLRGRLGALQKTTIDTNIKTLNDTLENLTGAESSIRDADFAAESANLTRAQILVQSGTSVLAIANQSPQNVLSLLRG